MKPAFTHSGPCCSPRAGLSARALLLEALSALNGPRGMLPWDAPSPESLDSALPDFHILRLVGRGGMGAVYEARQKRLDRRVAIKLLPDELALDPEFARRFRTEGRLLARLLHQGVVTVFDSGESTGGHLFMVMEFVDGETLRDRLRREHPDTTAAVALLTQISQAVAAAHEHGVAHRDLKPSNIMLTRRGEVKVADFGMAGLMTPDGTEPDDSEDLPHSGGTPGYSAPEQLMGLPNSGPRADVFSLGVISYEVFTGQRPASPPLPPSQLAMIDPRLDAPILRALHPAPAERQQDAAGFLTDLNHACEAISTEEKTRRRLRRARILTAAFAGIGAVALIAGAIAFWQGRLARKNEKLAIAGQQAVTARESQMRTMSSETDSDLAQEYASRETEEWPPAVAHLARALRTDPDNKIAASRLVDLLTSQPWLLPATPVMQHGTAVHWAEYDADGRHIASASDDNTARVWNAKTGEPLTPPLKHGGAVHRASFNPDGTRLLTISSDHFARIWKLDAPEKPEIEIDCGSPVLCGQFTPDGRKFVTGCEDGRLHVWFSNTGQAAMESLPHPAAIIALAISPDGKIVAVDLGPRILHDGDTSKRVWNIEAAIPVVTRVPAGHSLPVQFSPDGKILLVDHSRSVCLVEPLKGTVMAQRGFARIDKTEFHAPSVAAFSPDSRLVLMASNAGIANIWAPARGNWAGPDLRHRGAVTSVAFSADGARIAVGTERGVVKLWDTWDGAALAVPLLLNSYAVQVRFSPDGLRLLTASGDGKIQQWDVSHGPALSRSFLHPQRSVLASAFSPDGQLLATSCTSGSGADVLSLWQSHSDQPPSSVPAGDKLWCMSFRHDGKRIAVARRVHPAVIYDAGTLAVVAELPHELPTNWADYSPSGEQVVVAHQNGLAQIWEMGRPVTKGLSLKMPGHVNSATYSPDGSRIVTASTDSWARIWNARTGDQIMPALPHQSCVQFAEYSRDGRFILTASEDGAARVWDAQTCQPVTNPMLHGGSVLCARFSPDGTKVATASDDNYARLWDARSGKLLIQPVWHPTAVLSVCFSPDGYYFITTDHRSAARMIQVRNFDPVPAWFCDFAETVAGARLDDVSPVPAAAGDIARVKEERLADTRSGQYSQIARWFFQRGSNRPAAPEWTRTVREHVRHLLSLECIDAPQEASRAQPANPGIILRQTRNESDLQTWLRTYPAALLAASQHSEWRSAEEAPRPAEMARMHWEIAGEWRHISEVISEVRDVKNHPEYDKPGFQETAGAAEKYEPRKREEEERKLAEELDPGEANAQ